LTGRHLAILLVIGDRGVTPDGLGHHLLAREFDDLRSEGLIVFWQEGQFPPAHMVGSGPGPGAWYLTPAGADAIELDLPRLRTTP
jgi:hypothetical protein